jgi:hypothetical protein
MMLNEAHSATLPARGYVFEATWHQLETLLYFKPKDVQQLAGCS